MRALPLAALLLAGCAQEAAPIVVVHPDGRTEVVEDCNKGCNAPTPDETHLLTEAEFRTALTEIANNPVGAGTLGLDTLLFHFTDVPELFARYGDAPLTEGHRAWVDRELSRTTVDVGFRLVGDDGQLLGSIQQHIPLKTKQHLVLEGTGALKRIEVNGKTKRVGLQHLWSRW